LLIGPSRCGPKKAREAPGRHLVLRHLGVGRAFAGRRVLLLVAGARVRVLTSDGELIVTVKIDPAEIYQPMP
jgi:hypothetical protein